MRPMAVVAANKAQSGPPGPARQLGAEEQQLAKETFLAPASSQGMDKLLPAAAPSGADRRQTAESEMAASAVTPAPSPVGSINGAYERRYGLAAKSAPPASVPATPAAPAPVAATVAAASAVAADDSIKLTADSASRPAPAYKPSTEAASANRLGSSPAITGGLGKPVAFALKEDKSFSVAQRFTQIAVGTRKKVTAADKAKSAQPVLASFQVEQNGSELRIMDADGSVYSGYVQLADNVRRARPARLEAPAAAPAAQAPKDAVQERYVARLDSDQLGTQTYYFRVTGTNRSLHKQVVFTGNLLPATPATASAPLVTNLSAGTGFGGPQTRSAQQLPLPLQNSRISGKVVIGNANAVEISAEPARP